MLKICGFLLLLLSPPISSFIPAHAADVSFGEATIMLHTGGGTHTLRVQLAATPEQRRLGLMFRDTLAPYDGMLFDFGVQQPVRMWMKNTGLPLDMIFFDAKRRAVHVHHKATPYSEAAIATPHPARYVLELPAGRAAQWGLQPGDHWEMAP